MSGRTKEYSFIVQKLFEELKCTEEQTLEIISLVLEDIRLFDKKQHDYGSQNIAKFGTFGVLVRSSDKIERLIHLNHKGDDPYVDESVNETWQDLSVYGMIARVVNNSDWFGGTEISTAETRTGGTA